MSAGRPQSPAVTDKLDLVLLDIASTGNVAACLRRHEVAVSTFYQRVVADPTFAERYTRAKQHGCNAVAEEAMDFARQQPPRNHAGDCDSGWASYQRTRLDFTKFYLSKIMPKVYGERVTHANDPDNPIPPMVVVQSTPVAPQAKAADDDDGITET